MSYTVEVKCKPDDDAGFAIRTLFCAEAALQPEPKRNPLITTDFNRLLDKISQIAFDEGRRYERDNSEKKTKNHSNE